MSSRHRIAAMWTVAQLAQDLATGKTTNRALVGTALARIGDPRGEGGRAFLEVHADTARAETAAADRLRASGVERLPLPLVVSRV